MSPWAFCAPRRCLMTETEIPETSETPEYDQLVTEQGDPQPVLASLCGDLDQSPPCIEQAHPEPATASEDEDRSEDDRESTSDDDVSEATA